MMTAVPKRRWLRFSLRNLLAAFVAAAVLAWIYWIGWDLWEQKQLERSVKLIRRGDTFGDALLATGRHNKHAVLSAARNRLGTEYGWIRFEWPNAIYFLIGTLEPPPGGDLESRKLAAVNVYRFPATPNDYSPKTELGHTEVNFAALHKLDGGLQDPPQNIAYWYDSIEMLIGDSPEELDLQYELIHSD